MTTYFVSSNPKKHADVSRIFLGSKHPPRILDLEIVEVLSSDLKTVVQEKARTAYKQILVPVIVEHGGLYVDFLDKLPGPLVKLFWEKLDDRLPGLIPPGASRRATVVQMVCYCDGKTLKTYRGAIQGKIATTKRGCGGMHWEPMFVPNGHIKTLGEMTPKERISAHAASLAYRSLRRDLGI